MLAVAAQLDLLACFLAVLTAVGAVFPAFFDLALASGDLCALLIFRNTASPGSLTAEELRRRRPASFEDSYETVRKTFRAFENVTIVRGVVPDTLEQVKSERIAYLSLDMNAAAPEVAAAEYFWPRMVSGAVMVLDDYGWPYHEVQKRELDAFAARRGVKVLPMPTGQGLIFKP